VYSVRGALSTTLVPESGVVVFPPFGDTIATFM
jgi:hypothetical protein